MFITYKQVKEYVDQAKPGETIGRCGSAFHCIVAEATQRKYPDYEVVEVRLDHDKREIHIRVQLRAGYGYPWEEVTYGDDGDKLFDLADAFDRLGDYYASVNREKALALFQ
jgi:hypothetical protein